METRASKISVCTLKQKIYTKFTKPMKFILLDKSFTEVIKSLKLHSNYVDLGRQLVIK